MFVLRGTAATGLVLPWVRHRSCGGPDSLCNNLLFSSRVYSIRSWRLGAQLMNVLGRTTAATVYPTLSEKSNSSHYLQRYG
ncbi:uncharacterized protein BDZ83DRAFT_637199 [Colletotrichum acutatum]|uniref:Uncharacterized protein n=1 Tax=Glomerella acutata TaxID=27357 RepID=A0AAD8UDL1_GLOAC|nr:uncharacterized protein BDZ83DRAFT_637199 [Colletotrichum acutatum]KAK1713766.1 hypothetical protein BDZ83DRAFT_637199 [Colletotrichum acutatum]